MRDIFKINLTTLFWRNCIFQGFWYPSILSTGSIVNMMLNWCRTERYFALQIKKPSLSVKKSLICRSPFSNRFDQQGPRSVPARLQRSRRLIGDLFATKSVAARFLCLHKNLAATDLVADRSRQSRRPVPDQSPTDRRLILLESERGYH